MVQRRYIPGAAIDERVAQVDANGGVKYIHTDRQNSVIAISDSSGNAISRRAYGTYGETDSSQISNSIAHPFGYTGRRWEADLGLYYYRARWYDPETATFLETDPIGQLDYINLYAYVGLEPGNKTDPSGTQRVPPPPRPPASRPNNVAGEINASRIEGWNARGRALDPKYQGYTYVGNNPNASAVSEAKEQFARFQASWANSRMLTLGANQPGARYQKLFESANETYKNSSMTNIGRAVQKHGVRDGSSFPNLSGQKANTYGNGFLNDLITNSQSRSYNVNTSRFGNVLEVRDSSGRGARYTHDGRFIGLLEPDR